MSTRTPARHRGPDHWPSPRSGDLDFYSPAGDGDPQPARPAEAQPPWAEFDADDTDPGSTLLAGNLDRKSVV